MVTELRKFLAPEIITGIDARLMIGRYLTHFASKKPMVVTDKNLTSLPWFLDIMDEIHNTVFECIIYDNVTSNPRDHEVMEGAELFRTRKCDLIIAVGGGSPIDCAKGISIVTSNGGHILDYEGVDEINLPGPPLICIPTTSGASADVSQFAIICDTDAKVKKAIISKKVVPDLALIDPVPLMTMGPYLTACCGMDALTHAIEAYVSNANSDLTNVHALAAISLINQSIIAAICPARSLQTMHQMMLGSLHAGLAFSNASLGAVHAMAHSLGGLLDMPHGECNSILLEHVIRVNFASASVQYKEIARQMGIVTDGLTDEQIEENLLEHIRFLRRSLYIKDYAYLTDLNHEIIEKLTDGALSDPCLVTNPKILTKEEVKAIYGEVLRQKE
jgi:alcohol dehydrogenase class IV